MSINLKNIERIISDKLGLETSNLRQRQLELAIERIQDGRNKELRVYDFYDDETIIELAEHLKVPETWFFRDPEGYKLMVSYLKENYFGKPIRILSMPCSTGEEPYSIAMSLDRNGISLDKAKIFAYDISSESIAMAKKGIYGRNSFRGSNEDYMSYFDEISMGYAIDENIKKQINFKRINIISDKISGAKFNVIFLKNFIIYLNDDARRIVLDKLDNLLHENGLLITGHSETGFFLTNGFSPAGWPKSFGLFRKQKTAKKESTINIKSIKKSYAKREIIRHVEIASHDSADDYDALLSEIKQLANEGNYGEALSKCKKLIELSKTEVEPYYLLAVINEAMGNTAEAENYYHKALFLDPQHYESLINLSLIYELNNNSKQAELFSLRAEKAYKATNRNDTV